MLLKPHDTERRPLDLQTFISNSELQCLDLQNNTITDIHPSTFRNNSKTQYLDLSTNLLNVIYSTTFQYDVNLKFLLLENKIYLILRLPSCQELIQRIWICRKAVYDIVTTLYSGRKGS